MAKCTRCGTSGFALKLDSRGICEPCQFAERAILNDRITKLEDELTDLRSFYDRYQWVPGAESDAAKLVEDAKLQAQTMIQDAEAEIARSRSAFQAEMDQQTRDFDAYKSSAELELATRREKLEIQLQKLKTDTNTVVVQTKEQLSALFAIAAREFDFSAKVTVGASAAAEQKAAKKRTPGKISFDLSPVNPKQSFTALAPAAFRRAASRGYVVFDLETTGLNRAKDKIIEIAAIKFDDSGNEAERFTTLINPEISIPPAASAINHITDDMVRSAPLIWEDSALPAFLAFVGDLPLIAHNAEFDIAFLRAAIGDMFVARISYGDSLAMCRKAYSLPGYRLEDVATHLGFGVAQSHRAMGDCEMLAFVVRDLLTRS